MPTRVFEGDARWRAIPVPAGDRYAWDAASTYIAKPPFFEEGGAHPERISIAGARALAVLGDSITTDHISPAGSIAGVFDEVEKGLVELGVVPIENSTAGRVAPSTATMDDRVATVGCAVQLGDAP